MAHVLFLMFPEEGHILASLKIARSLQARGHTVSYLAMLDFEPFIRAQGFAFLPLLAERFPLGTRQQQIDDIRNFKPGWNRAGRASARRFFKAFVHQQFHEALHDRLMRQGIQELAGGAALDLLIIDPFLPAAVIAAYASGIPAVALSVNLIRKRSDQPLVPPLTTALPPPTTRPQRMAVQLAWTLTLLMRNAMFTLIGFRPRRQLQQLARRYRFATRAIEDTSFFPVIRPDSHMPLLVLCPSALEFPYQPQDGLHYIEASVDLASEQPELVWDGFDPSKQTIFCTLGSQSHINTNSQRFFQAVIDAVAGQDQWQVIIAIGRYLDTASLGPVPPNVLVVNWAPHTAVLRKSALMINHGGLGTIKECVLLGVPMLMFPFMRDNPGYAARAAYHGLGLVYDMREATPDFLRDRISTLLTTPSFRERTAAMQQAFLEAEERSAGLQQIERILTRRNVASV